MSRVLFVFNPDHDLCLANGNRNYLPPASALAFARDGVGVMRMLYGDNIQAIAADDFAMWRDAHPEIEIERIVPWGWDLRLKQTLLAQGCPHPLLPDDEWIGTLRRMQGRDTVVALQEHSWVLSGMAEVEEVLLNHPELVLKLPWSGAGRGLRWISHCLTEKDRDWLQKAFKTYRFIVAEKRFHVEQDFAIEYQVTKGEVIRTGYSLFKTQAGVYRYNMLYSDAAIRRLVGLTDSQEASIQHWIECNVAPFYDGPLGIDLFRTDEGICRVSEMNLRHTMGQVAHRYLQTHPEEEGKIWIPPQTNKKV